MSRQRQLFINLPLGPSNVNEALWSDSITMNVNNAGLIRIGIGRRERQFIQLYCKMLDRNIYTLGILTDAWTEGIINLQYIAYIYIQIITLCGLFDFVLRIIFSMFWCGFFNSQTVHRVSLTFEYFKYFSM